MTNKELKNKIATLKQDITRFERLVSEAKFFEDSEAIYQYGCTVRKLKKELATCKSLLPKKPFVTIGDLVNFEEV